MYKSLDIDRKNLTIMGVKFPNIEKLESAANAIGTNMFEGFEPTKELIQLYENWKTGIISETDFLAKLYTIYGK
jgi:putative transcriptional regulator